MASGDDQEVLEGRARQLAEPVASARGGEGAYLVFGLGHQRLAIEARYVWRVLARVGLTHVPGATGELMGVGLLDGEILAVFDLRRVLGEGETLSATTHRVLVLGDGAPELGVVISEVDGVVELTSAEIGGQPRSSGAPTLIRGLGPGGMLIVDGGRLLADERLVVEQGFER